MKTRIKITKQIAIEGKTVRPGDIIDVAARIAVELLGRGAAVVPNDAELKRVTAGPVPGVTKIETPRTVDLAELAKAPRAELLKVLDDLGVKAAPGTSKADLLEQIADVLAKAE